MKEWLTARELAAQRLSDLPHTERAIQIMAERDDWNNHPSYARKRAARGGGMEFHIALLPTLAQIEYKQRHMAVEQFHAERTAAQEASPEPLSDKAETERSARLSIVKKFEQFADGLSVGRASQMQVFTDKYNLGTIAVDDWIKEVVPTLSKRSLARWISLKKNGKSSVLGVDRSKARRGKGILATANDGAVQRFILAMVAHQPHLSAHHVRTLCRDEFGDQIEGAKGMVNMPPVRTFQHFLKALKEDNKAALTKLTNPDKYRSTMAPSGVGSLRHITEINALWQIDASPVDALCIDGRYSLYACIDIASRRTIITLSKTPRASAVALLIRKAILAWGVPDTIKTDNGSDFVAKDTKRLLASLDVTIDVSDAYTPQQKGHVERVIKTFQHEVGTLLPGFIGHNVADRSAIESRKSFAERLGESDAETFGVELTAPDLQVKIDEWLDLVYQHNGHAGLKGQTPYNVAAASTSTMRTVDERALDLLLMPAAGKDGFRRVTKFGIKIDHRYYMAPDIMHGTDVFVRQDPLDMGRVYAYSADSREFLGEAICPELSGIHPETFVKAAKELQNEKMDEATRQIKKDMREIKKGPALIDRVLDVARRDVPNVVTLPKKTTEHTTPEIAAALDAADAGKPRRSNMTPEAERIHAELTQQAHTLSQPTAEPKVTRLPETAKLRFRRAQELEAQLSKGDEIDTETALWLGRYQASSEYKSQKTLFEDFGGQAPVTRT